MIYYTEILIVLLHATIICFIVSLAVKNGERFLVTTAALIVSIVSLHLIALVSWLMK